MSLNFNHKNMADGGDCLWDGNLSTPLCYAITHGLMFASMSGITEENASEVYARIHLVEKVSGALRTKFEDGNVVEVFVTPEEIRKCIGITVNVGNETRTKFMGGLVKNIVNGWKTDFERES